MKRRKLSETSTAECIIIEDEDDDFMPSLLYRGGTVSKFADDVAQTAASHHSTDDLMSQAAAEGFIESDSDSSDEFVRERKEHDDPKPALSSSTSVRRPALPKGTSQGTLDRFLGLPPKSKSTDSIPDAELPPFPSGHDIQTKDRAPFYKRIPETSFLVDDFRFAYKEPASQHGVQHFFLSHFHSDHYGGLNKNFNRGIIVCSQVTANLLKVALGVDEKFIRALPLREETELPTGNQSGQLCSVTLYDANHCPGAVCFVFKVPSGRTHLHTGDFRWDRTTMDHQSLCTLPVVDSVYLDTTYCNPDYDFPPQSSVVQRAIELMSSHLEDSRTAFIVGAYTIGKERIFLKAAEVLGQRILCSAYKFKVLGCLNLEPGVASLLTKDDPSARIQVVPIGSINFKAMEVFLKDKPRWKKVVCFKPTGWTFVPGATHKGSSAKPNSDFRIRQKRLPNGAEIIIYDCPYSEHSSFGELRDFVGAIKPRNIIPTVNNYNGDKVRQMIQLLTAK